MRNLLLASMLVLACCLGFNSQLKAQATNSTCQNALMVGAINPSYPLPVNQPSAPAGNNYNCLGSQPNPLWFYFQLNTAGSIELLLSNTSNVDVDFILYGPFASANAALAGCGNLGNGGSGATVVDCSFSSAANELVNVNNGNAGEFYMLLVTNFSNSPTTGNTQIVLGNNSTATMVNPYVGVPVVVGTCANTNNGSISTMVTNGLAPYTYMWSNGATTSGISGLSAGFYSFTVTDANGATFANNSINVPTIWGRATNTISICQGDSALIFGTWRSVAGVYTDTVVASVGCDSIYTTLLSVIRTYGTTNYDLCAGDSMFLAGAWQFISGYYTDTIVNPSGCDSIVDTYLNFYVCTPVWPGDADDNLVVDGDDWLQLGFGTAYTGSIRNNASINWVGQPAIDWGLNVGMAEAKHADCNGDGQVDGNDSFAIIQNYSLTHVRAAANSTINSGADIQLIPQQTTYNVGDLVKIDVVLGQNSAALTDVYGYFFKIDVGNIFRTGSLQFTTNNSFLGTNTEVWTLSKELNAANQIDISQVRHNQSGRSGFGKVGEISFILSNNSGNSSPVLGFVNDKIVNSSNTVIPVTTSAATFNVNPTSVQNNTNYNFVAKIVPNPVLNQAYLEFELAENSTRTEIRVINNLGQVQSNQVLSQLNAGTHRVDLQSNLAAGTYFVEIRNQNQTARIPFVKIQ